MAELQLLEPTYDMKKQIMAYRKEYLAERDNINGSGGLHRYEDFDEYYKQVVEKRTGQNKGGVPATQYFAFVDGKPVGSLQLRHYLNEELLLAGGHIGYGVLKNERRKGYAGEMLRLALEKCREIGLSRVLITCDKGNVGSAKTICKNGGVFENELFVKEKGHIVERYWIEL